MNSNQAPMMSHQRDLGRKGFICNCIYCYMYSDVPARTVRTRQNRAWKKDQELSVDRDNFIE